MMNKRLIVGLFLITVLAGCREVTAEKNWKKLNARAAKEYLEPIRPGYEGRNPYWNVFAKKFIYAPAFDFKEIAGAERYRFLIKGKNGFDCAFEAKSPHAPLTTTSLFRARITEPPFPTGSLP